MMFRQKFPFWTHPAEPWGTTDPAPTQINLHTLSSHLAPETLWLLGHICENPVHILIDGGSTHDFIKESLVRALGFTAKPTTSLRVMVGNDHQLQCNLLCKNVAVTIQSMLFLDDLHVLPLCGTNVVLGVQWLKSLGLVLTDYNDLTMKFIREGHLIELKGDMDSSLHAISTPQLRCLIKTDNASQFFHLRIISRDLPWTQTSSLSLPPKISNLITQFANLFQTPTTLPPSRPTNYNIHLLPTAKPVNVHPYRYPHF